MVPSDPEGQSKAEEAVSMIPQPVIVTQPQQIVVVQQQRGQWQTGLCDCCIDCGVCCCGAFCFPCLICQVAADMNECCCCGSSVALRSVYRTKYNIPGSICNDYCTIMCCPVFSLCQIKRDINRRRELGIF